MNDLAEQKKEQALAEFDALQRKRLSVGKMIIFLIVSVSIAMVIISAVIHFNIYVLVIQITLSIALFAGIRWVKYLFVIEAALDCVLYTPYLLLFVLVNPSVWAIALLLFGIGIDVALCILLLSNRCVNEFLSVQKSGYFMWQDAEGVNHVILRKKSKMEAKPLEQLAAQKREQALTEFESLQKERMSIGKMIVFLIASINVVSATLSAVAHFNIFVLVIQIVLSITLFFGVRWVKYFFAIGGALGALYGLYVLLVVLEHPPLWAVIFLLLSMGYGIASCIMLLSNQCVDEFLYVQKNG